MKISDSFYNNNFWLYLEDIQRGKFEFLGEIIMSSKGNLILAIIWIILSPAWFWAENTAMGIIWLCAGVTKLIIALIRRNKEKKSK